MSEETRYGKLLGIISQMQMIKCRIDRRADMIASIGSVRQSMMSLNNFVDVLEHDGLIFNRALIMSAVRDVLIGEQEVDKAKLDVLLGDVARGAWNE